MNLLSNPYVKAELDNLRLQFNNKAYLDLDDYSNVMRCGREKASRHLKMRDIKHSKTGQVILIPILEMALYFARKSAEREGRVLVFPETQEDKKNRTGFARKAHEAQLVGNSRTDCVTCGRSNQKKGGLP